MLQVQQVQREINREIKRERGLPVELCILPKVVKFKENERFTRWNLIVDNNTNEHKSWPSLPSRKKRDPAAVYRRGWFAREEQNSTVHQATQSIQVCLGTNSKAGKTRQGQIYHPTNLFE